MENNTEEIKNPETVQNPSAIIEEPVRRSRLAKSMERRTMRNIVLMGAGILLILFILLKFGIDALVNFSVFVTSRGQNTQTNSQNEVGYIPPPFLNSLNSATNSAHIIITGTADKGRQIDLFINNTSVDSVTTDKDGKFTFNEDLKKGDNTIKVRAEQKGKYSDFSDSYTVTYNNSQPKLDVKSPTDGQTFTKNDNNPITVSGSTDPNVTVTVNGFWATIDNNNNFSYNLTLQNGDNDIKIIAVDQAGNKSEKDLKVKYNQ